MQKISTHNIILTIIGIITVGLGIMIFIDPPSIYPDPSHGFQVLRSMQMGSKFNMLVSPNQDNISKNNSDFLTWWSPGQYLIPYWFKLLFGLNTGRASALLIILFQLSGLAGFYCFFKKIGFTSLVSAISLVLIICQQAFIIPYIFYSGGEILVFGFEGWFLYGCIAIEKPGIKLLLFVLLSGWIGFLCKSSFMWVYVAGLMCLWLRLSAIKGRLNIQRLIKNGIWLAIPAAISLAAIYVFFLSKGANPASNSTGFTASWQAIGFPLGSPLLSGFSVDDLLHGLIFHQPGNTLTPAYVLPILFLTVLVSLILILAIVRYVPKNNYRLFILIFYAISVLFFSVAFLRQLNISYESRHFRILSLMLAPGIIYLFSRFKPVYQILFGLICLYIGFINYSTLARIHEVNNLSARGNTGIAQQSIDQPSLDYLLQLDKQNTNAIFAFLTPDVGLEIEHNRIITLDQPPANIPFDDDDYSYDGHAGPLYIVLPASYDGAQASMIMKFFRGYKDFSIQKLSPMYTLYSAK
ncbi:hypothetical protein HDF18_22300 [Mucilaginibacter sp. X5P1]|uniref:hypothetical protein n=1 Tax=Mucilaginibacter sp. X5P1 TaxID=2723088 RepID=UPI00161647C3|nr:hypothetical protein [Mucilaginibacter sp. X5P1]MBB6141009.1 hypothetical protein [Mucilaginibacter sp. X5P1]